MSPKMGYADGSAAGDLKSIRALLDKLDVHGKILSYNVKPSKCQFIEKENCREGAIEVFETTKITMVDSFRVLGSVIGTPSACDNFMEIKIEKTTNLTKKPFKKIETSPQNACSCYTKKIKIDLIF